MKVLVASFAHQTHFQGLVPLAWALTAAGHQVRVASQPALATGIAGAGLTAVPVGTDHKLFDIDPVDAAAVHKYSTGLDFARRKEELHTWEFLHGLEQANARFVFPRVNNQEFVSELVAYASHWKPDLVLWEPFTFAGAIAARTIGVPHARVTWGTDLTGYFRSHLLDHLRTRAVEDQTDPLADWLAEVAGRFGIEYSEDLAVGHWTIDQLPRRFRLDSGLDSMASVLVPYNGPSEVPRWLRSGSRRRIAVTGGFSGLARSEELRGLLETLSDFDQEVVVTRSGLSAEQVPANVRLVDFVPMNALLESCDAIVHHGGAGTWASALHQAVPQVTVAHEWDCLLRSQQVADAGAGISLDSATGDTLQDAIHTVLSHSQYARNARELRSELRNEPAPLAVVEELEQRVSDFST